MENRPLIKAGLILTPQASDPIPPGEVGLWVNSLGELVSPIGEGTSVALRRIISQPSDGSDFMVTLPTALGTDLYGVTATLSKGTTLVVIGCPVNAPSDRTLTQFRCVTSASLNNGDTIDFNIQLL